MFPDRISVVVAVYNSERTIAQVLQSILTQDYPHPIEVVVVDDGSTDSTATIIKTFPRVKYFYQENQGPAVARNQGARLASGDFIFFIDSDCVAKSDWIQRNIVHFFDPSVAVVSGSYDIMNSENLLARVIHAEIIFRHRFLMPKYPKVFGSYNFSIRKKVFDQVGGFNVGYRYPSGEDNDLSYKVIHSGHKIFFALDSLVGHYHTTRLLKYLKEQFRHGFWRVKMYRDHPCMGRGDDYTFWKDIVEIPLALGILFILILLVFKVFMSYWVIRIALFFLFFLSAIELYYAFRMVSSCPERFFLFCVMWLRSFFRALGFSSGFFYFFLSKNLKKSK